MILLALRVVRGIRIETGRIKTPYGSEINGFKVTIGGIQDPAEIKRSYDDIERIFKSNEKTFKVTEEHNPNGTFKTYTAET